MDLFEQRISPEDYRGNEVLTFGYDEISQTGIHISKSLGENKGLAEIERGNGIVSIHRMKYKDIGYEITVRPVSIAE